MKIGISKPCPFCGSQALRAPEAFGDRLGSVWSGGYFVLVRCLDCFAEGPHVEVRHTREDGEFYGYRFKVSASNRTRIIRERDEATERAITLWNKRST